MATIRRFRKIQKERFSKQTDVECGWVAFTDSDGRTFLQLDTYGSDQRMLQDKVSQSLRLDERAAAELMSILKKTFPHLR